MIGGVMLKLAIGSEVYAFASEEEAREHIIENLYDDEHEDNGFASVDEYVDYLISKCESDDKQRFHAYCAGEIATELKIAERSNFSD